MKNALILSFAAFLLIVFALGCTGRIISESKGIVLGASGKIVERTPTPDLSAYKGFQVGDISIAPGIDAPIEILGLIQTDIVPCAQKRDLAADGSPALRFSGEVIHYETNQTIDHAIGPLEEVILHAKLTDVQSGAVIAEANILGRSKASSSRGPKILAGGVAKALDHWLKDGGLKTIEEKQKEQEKLQNQSNE